MASFLTSHPISRMETLHLALHGVLPTQVKRLQGTNDLMEELLVQIDNILNMSNNAQDM